MHKIQQIFLLSAVIFSLEAMGGPPNDSAKRFLRQNPTRVSLATPPVVPLQASAAHRGPVTRQEIQDIATALSSLTNGDPHRFDGQIRGFTQMLMGAFEEQVNSNLPSYQETRNLLTQKAASLGAAIDPRFPGLINQRLGEVGGYGDVTQHLLPMAVFFANEGGDDSFKALLNLWVPAQGSTTSAVYTALAYYNAITLDAKFQPSSVASSQPILASVGASALPLGVKSESSGGLELARALSVSDNGRTSPAGQFTEEHEDDSTIGRACALPAPSDNSDEMLPLSSVWGEDSSISHFTEEHLNGLIVRLEKPLDLDQHAREMDEVVTLFAKTLKAKHAKDVDFLVPEVLLWKEINIIENPVMENAERFQKKGSLNEYITKELFFAAEIDKNPNPISFFALTTKDMIAVVRSLPGYDVLDLYRHLSKVWSLNKQTTLCQELMLYSAQKLLPQLPQ